MTETRQPVQIVRHRMVIEVAAYDLSQPCANLAYGVVRFRLSLSRMAASVARSRFLIVSRSLSKPPLVGSLSSRA